MNCDPENPGSTHWRGCDCREAAQAERIERLEEIIGRALTTANGRWGEWGARAEAVEEILREAESPRAALAPAKGGERG